MEGRRIVEEVLDPDGDEISTRHLDGIADTQYVALSFRLGEPNNGSPGVRQAGRHMLTRPSPDDAVELGVGVWIAFDREPREPVIDPHRILVVNTLEYPLTQRNGPNIRDATRPCSGGDWLETDTEGVAAVV